LGTGAVPPVLAAGGRRGVGFAIGTLAGGGFATGRFATGTALLVASTDGRDAVIVAAGAGGAANATGMAVAAITAPDDALARVVSGRRAIDMPPTATSAIARNAAANRQRVAGNVVDGLEVMAAAAPRVSEVCPGGLDSKGAAAAAVARAPARSACRPESAIVIALFVGLDTRATRERSSAAVKAVATAVLRASAWAAR
jgi:hypothetical protein